MSIKALIQIQFLCSLLKKLETTKQLFCRPAFLWQPKEKQSSETDPDR